MSIFNRKKKVEFQAEPYAFKVGGVYVIEISKHAVSMKQGYDLEKWLNENGVIARVVGVEGNYHAISPVESVIKKTR